MLKIRTVFLGVCLGALLFMGCSENSKQDSDSAKKADQSLRKRFMLENQGTRAEVSVPKAEAESASGTYLVRVRERSGSVQSLVHDRNGFLQDAWLVDVGNDGETELVVWVEPESGVTQIDWYTRREGDWQQRSLPTLPGKWTYEIRRGVFFAESESSEDSSGYTFSVPANEWEPGLPTFE